MRIEKRIISELNKTEKKIMSVVEQIRKASKKEQCFELSSEIAIELLTVLRHINLIRIIIVNDLSR